MSNTRSPNDQINAQDIQFANESEYWLNQLSGDLEKATFPYDLRTTAADKYEPATVEVEFSDEICSRLMKLRNESDARLFMVVATIVITTLYKYSGQKDILVGTPIYKQEIEGSAEFINTILVLRNRLSNEMSFKELLLSVRQTLKHADENQNYPYKALLNKLGLSMSETDFPLFDVAVLLENIHDQEYLEPVTPAITFQFLRISDTIDLEISYNALLYSKEAIEDIGKRLSLIMEKALGDVNITLEQLDILTSGEKDQLLVDFNDTAADIAVDRPLHRIFEDQVDKNPDSIAVDFKGTRLSYQQLNEKANRLANLLRKKGIGPGSIVALLIERSIDTVIAMLSVLKSGGAYLPIDSSLPPQRVMDILKDSQASLLISGTGRVVAENYSFTALQGLADKRAVPHHNPPRQQIKDLDRLPIPNRSLIDYNKYNQYIGQVMAKDIISLQTARGCPYDCAYCSKIWSKKHVFRSAEDTFKELKLYYDMGVRRFSIFDDIFNINRENGKRFFRMIIDSGMDVQFFFPNGLRGDLLDKEYIDLAVEAGLKATALALETASPRLQKLINKNLNLDIFRENVEYFCEKYPQVILELFSMHGFPSETEEEARMTMDFIKAQRWIHFPYVFILKIYPNTSMAELALNNGVHREDILKCEDMQFHELSPTSPFKKSFTKNYQAEFLNDYFLNKERLLQVLPYQAKVLTKDELVQKYDSYLPYDVNNFEDLLSLVGISKEELGIDTFIPDDHYHVPDLNEKIQKQFPIKKTADDAFRVLFLDLSQYFSTDTDMLYDVVEPPLGALYIMTYLDQQLGEKVKGKIAKSRIDFDNFDQLEQILKEFDPQLIALRSLTFYRDFFHRTVAHIRQWGYNVPIIAGGPYATRNSDTLLQDANIDLLVVSEGEETFCELIEKTMANNGQLPDEKALESINGISFIPRSSVSKAQFAREILSLDQLEKELEQSSPENPEIVNSPSDPAYVIYTSGSTGKPKGVMVEHRNITNLLQWFGTTYNVKPGDNVIQLTNYTFDPSVEQIFGSLTHGASVFMGDKTLLADRESFIRFMNDNQVNMINFVPASLDELLCNDPQPQYLETVISGGEKLDEETKNKLINCGYKLYNHYGPTETTIEAVTGPCSLEEKVTLGKPVANARCYILGKDMNLLPVGVAGELIIGGSGVARGYLNRPQLTSERFIPDPFVPGEHWMYRTGDMARWLPDGRIQFLGRIDHQIKMAGFRIELGEIENHILSHQYIKEAAVVLVENDGSQAEDMDSQVVQKYLTAYIVAEEEIPESELREHLSWGLPEYMVPSFFVTLPEMPITSTGKIDRRELINRALKGMDQQELVAPRTDMEKKIADIWQEVIGKPEIGIYDNFFMIGGDSIKAIQIVSRMNNDGLKIKMSDVFQNPVIADLAPLVTETKSIADQSIVSGTAPLSPAQAGYFSEKTIDLHHYNQSVMLSSAEGFPMEAIQAVFKKLVNHHDALRAVFPEENGEIIQKFLEDCPIDVAEFDLHDITDQKILFDNMLEMANKVQGGIDLANGPLLKLGLFHLKDGDRLLIVVHHLVMDGISWRIMFEDINTLFRQYKEGSELQLPLKTDSFKLWMESLSKYADGETLLEEKDYWKTILNSEIPPLKKDFPEGSRGHTNSMVCSSVFEKEETEQLLSKVNEAFNTEINDILLTAFGLAYKDSFDCDRVLIALEGHGREEIIPDIDISRTVGWFTSLYPILVDVTGNESSGDLGMPIKSVKESLRKIPNKGMGYGILKYLTSPENKTEIAFDSTPTISFNYLGQFDADVEKMDFNVAAEPTGYKSSPQSEREFELDITIMIAGGRLRTNMSFSKEQFNIETIETLLNNYKKNLTNIINFCVGKEEQERTPSDFTYDQLSMDEVDSIGDMFDE